MADDDPLIATRAAGGQVARHLAGLVSSMTVLIAILVGYMAASSSGGHAAADALIVLGIAGVYALIMWWSLAGTRRRAYDKLPIRDDLRLSPSSASRRRGLLQGSIVGSLLLTLFAGSNEWATVKPSILLLAFPIGGTLAAFLEYCGLVRWQTSRALTLCRRPGRRRLFVSRVPTSESHVLIRAPHAPRPPSGAGAP